MRMFVSLLLSVVAVAAFTAYQQTQIVDLQSQLTQLASLPSAIDQHKTQAVDAIRAAALAAVDETTGKSRAALEKVAEDVSQDSIRMLEERLSALSRDLAAKQQQIATANRELSGAPEQVELEDLERLYGATGRVPSVEQRPYEFTTTRGSIWFRQSDVRLSYVPSTKSIAYIRIGKRKSSENSELINAWLSQATEAKLALGYKQVAKQTRSADYGEYTEAELRKGDMYFKTYFQYERIQGTYARHSVEYTFYLETGSIPRRDRHYLEQYNKKLGS